MDSNGNIKLLLTTPHLQEVVEPLYDTPKFIRPALAYIAGFLKEKSDCVIRCIDAKFEQKKLEEVLHEIENFNPDIIGISAYTYEMME